MNTLAERVKLAMEQSGMEQADLARACGISPVSVNDWLSGKTKTMKAEPAIAAADAMKVRIKWLVCNKGPMHETVFSKAKEDPVIASAVALMENTDATGRAMALAAVKVALSGYVPTPDSINRAA